MTFLNHGAFGAALGGVLESRRLWAEHIERQPVRFLDRELFPHLVHTTRELAGVLDCRPEDLLPMPNATTALNTVVRSWQRRFKPADGDEMVAFSVSYGSTKKLLRKVSEECGATLREVQVDFPLDDDSSVLDALGKALGPRTKLVVLDAMPSNAPFLFPVEEATQLCRQRAPDAIVVVDAAHGLGGFHLELGRHPADIVFTNCHKWFCGPKGTGALHVRESHQAWVEPLAISHGYGTDFVSGFYWAGLADFSSWLALDSALEFWEAVGLDTARMYSNSVVVEAAEMLCDAWGVGLGFPVELMGPMALVELPALPMILGEPGCFAYEHAEMVQNALFARGIEVPVKALSGRLYVRISAHIYNEIEDYEVLRDAVLELAGGGAK